MRRYISRRSYPPPCLAGTTSPRLVAQAISRARLAIHHLALRRAAESVQAVLAAAVAHPDPLVTELDTLARTLSGHAQTLARFQQTEIRAQAAALGLNDFDQQD